MSRTFLLIETGSSPATRTYTDYESVNACLEGVCKIYEEHLKRHYRDMRTISYDICQLYEFIDAMTTVTCFVHQRVTNSYIRRDKDWIKENIYVLLKRQAGGK